MRRPLLGIGVLLLGCASGEAPDGADPPAEIVPAPERSCEQRRDGARAEIEAVRAEQLGCAHDGDCTLASTATGCEWTCPVPVSWSGLPLLERAMHAAEARHCSGFRESGCLFVTATCLRAVAVCIEGQCASLREPLCRLDCDERGL